MAKKNNLKNKTNSNSAKSNNVVSLKKSQKPKAISKRVDSELNNIFTGIKLLLINFWTMLKKIKNIPRWLKSTPTRFKKWREEDRKKRKYRSFKLQKKIRPEPRYIPPITELIKESFKFLWRQKTIFVSIMLIHAVLYVLLLRTPITTNMTEIQSTLKTVLGEGTFSSAKGNLATMGAVLGASSSGQNSALVSVAVVLMSLVYIWTVRQLTNKQKINARDAYYQSMTPLIPALLILVVMSLQLIPFAVASFVYSTARTGGLFVSGFEDFSFFAIALLVGILSFYWITSTVMAFYIVTLPGMYPLKALAAAKKLVQFQRLTVFRRILALPIVIGLIYILFLLIMIRLLPKQTFWFVEAFPIIILPLIHIYLYKLYRALI